MWQHRISLAVKFSSLLTILRRLITAFQHWHLECECVLLIWWLQRVMIQWPLYLQMSLQRQKRVQSWGAMDSGISSNGRGTLAATKERTLVVYMYDRSDPVYANNLNYFIKRGMSSGDGLDYIFVVQNADNPQASMTSHLSWHFPPWSCLKSPLWNPLRLATSTIFSENAVFVSQTYIWHPANLWRLSQCDSCSDMLHAVSAWRVFPYLWESLQWDTPQPGLLQIWMCNESVHSAGSQFFATTSHQCQVVLLTATELRIWHRPLGRALCLWRHQEGWLQLLHPIDLKSQRAFHP